MTSRRRGESFWREVVTEFLARQEQGEEQRQAEYAEEWGVTKAALAYWVCRLTVPGPGGGVRRMRGSSAVRSSRSEVTEPLVTHRAATTAASSATLGGAPRHRRLQLTERDVAILEELAHDRANSVDVIARRHWATAAEPLRAARVRLEALEAAGHVELRARYGGVVQLTPRGARMIGVAPPRNMHPRHLRHHLETLRAIERYATAVRARGGEFVPFEGRGGRKPYLLEIHVQSIERSERAREKAHVDYRGNAAARGTAAGEVYDAAPDAVVRVRLPDGRGGFELRTVAVEYFTSKYSDKEIASKMQLHEKYDGVVQVSDTPRTAARVRAITGAECSTQGAGW